MTSGLVAVLFALMIVHNTLLGRAFLKTPLEGRFLAGAGIAIVGVGLMILHEYRAAAVGAGEVLLGTALTLAGVISASTANVMQGTAIARAVDGGDDRLGDGVRRARRRQLCVDHQHRNSVVTGKRCAVRVLLGGTRYIK